MRTFGASGTGVIRPAFSEEDMKARYWLKNCYQEAGLRAVLDGVGNVFGFSPNSGGSLLIGSHSDTQPEGGWLDGALGVIYGLEIARACLEDSATAHLSVDAVSWQDEESNFIGCLGSRSWCGLLDSNEEKAATGYNGEKLESALERVQLNDVKRLQIEPNRYVGYLEAHIEQGSYLEDSGNQIGVVTSIVGIRGLTISFIGEQNHAGTTTMARRKDAATAMFEFGHRINTEFPKIANERTVWTIGHVAVEPGATSIVPGRAELSLQFRDQDEGLLNELDSKVRSISKEIQERTPIQITMKNARNPIIPSKMDDNFQIHLDKAAEKTAPGNWQRMPSAAGHDPMVLHQKVACGMLFIPSINGISHDFSEDSHEADIVAGCQVLADATVSILNEYR